MIILNKKTWLYASILILPFFALIFYYIYFYSFAFSVNSDNAYFIRAAEEMITGNPFLKNWNGGFFSAFTGDLLWAATLRLFFSRKIVLYLIGPIAYAIIVYCSWFLMPFHNNRKFRIGNLILLLLILFVPPALRHPFMTVGMHGIAVAYMLILLLLTQSISSIQSDFKKKWLFGLFFLIAAAGCIADGFVLYYFILPLILSIIIRQFRSKSIDEIWLALLAFLAAVIGKTSTSLLNVFGFLKTGSTELQMISFENIFQYIQNTYNTWLIIFGFNRYENSNPFHSIGQMAGFLSAFIVLAALIPIFLHYFKSDLTTQVMAVGFAFVIGSFTFTQITNGEPAVRYLSPAFFIAIILISRTFQEQLPKMRKAAFIIYIPLIIFAASNISLNFRSSPENNRRYIEIAEVLRDRGLVNGYGTYWETHAMNYYAGNELQVAPIETSDGKIIPSSWASKTDWYSSDYDARFIIVSQNKKFGLNEALIVAEFGNYREHLNLHENDIYIYDINLSAVLSSKN